MNYSKIRNFDIANGEGVRVSLFVSGCTNHCPGCFNPEEQDFNFGTPYTDETAIEIKEMLKDPVISGLSILGGDPLCQDYEGICRLIDLCAFVRSIDKTVWLWTGFTWENIWKHPKYSTDLLYFCNVVIDGPFRIDLSDRLLDWRGSAN